MAELISPTVDLFVYDLRNELGQTPEEIQDNRDLFSQKLPANFSSLLWEKDNRYDAEFIELLGEKTRIENLPLSSKDYQGYYYPVRMQNAYGLLLSCTVKDKYTPYPVSCPSNIKTLLEKFLQGQPSTLGQTWMISACTESFTHKNAMLLAKECYEASIENANWEENITSTSNFLGGKLFELWHHETEIPEDLEESDWEVWFAEKLAKNHHVIIAIYPDIETTAAANYFVTEWMRLFCYRHQMLWNYSQSRLSKQFLETDLVDLQQYLEKSDKDRPIAGSMRQIETRLDQLREIFSDYSLDLNDLHCKIAAIETNFVLYCQQIDLFATSLTSEKLSGDIAFLQQFADLVRDKYLRFLRKDYEASKGVLPLLELATNVLRTEIEASQAKRDRAFQNTALSVGTGLGCGIAAAAIASHAPIVEQKQIETALASPVGKFMSENLSVPQMWVIPGISAAFSLTVAVVVAGVTRTILALGEGRK